VHILLFARRAWLGLFSAPLTRNEAVDSNGLLHLHFIGFYEGNATNPSSI